jgi:hypothetical protein
MYTMRRILAGNMGTKSHLGDGTGFDGKPSKPQRRESQRMSMG